MNKFTDTLKEAYGAITVYCYLVYHLLIKRKIKKD